MQYDALGDIIEFSIGLAGFSAVITAFLHRSRSLSPVDRFRTINLLLLALTPAFLVFLYKGLVLAFGDPFLVARISSAVFAGWLACVLILVYRAKRGLPAEHASALNNAIFLGMYAVATVLVILLGGSATFGHKHVHLIFYFGLVVMLLFAVVQFVRILIGVRVEDDV